MGNRVSTSASPFSLEELESMARASPLPSTPTSSGPGSSTLSLFDKLTADLTATVSTPVPNSAPTRACAMDRAARNAGGGGGRRGRHSVVSPTAASALHEESLKSELERQFADVDTTVHALRCVLDRGGGARSHPIFTKALLSEEQQMAMGSGGGGKDYTMHKGGEPRTVIQSKSPKLTELHSRSCNGNASGAGATGMTGKSKAPAGTRKRVLSRTRPVDSPPPSPPPPLPVGSLPIASMRHHLLRDVSVQPVDLTQFTEVHGNDVYVVVLVQRLSAQHPSMPEKGAAHAAAASGTGAAAFSSPSAVTTPPFNSARTTASTSNDWPREMLRLFSPRGLATAFSSDMCRTVPSSFPSGGHHWTSPSATPRTNGTTSSGRPTPRGMAMGNTSSLVMNNTANSGGGGAPGSPRSTASQRTPRTGGFHYSIHLLTGKKAEALTAAAGLLVARSLERLFLDYPDFDRRLFYHVHMEHAEELIAAYRLHAAAVAPRSRSVSHAAVAAGGLGLEAGSPSHTGMNSNGHTAAPGPSATATVQGSSKASSLCGGVGGGAGPTGSGHDGMGGAYGGMQGSSMGASATPMSSFTAGGGNIGGGMTGHGTLTFLSGGTRSLTPSVASRCPELNTSIGTGVVGIGGGSNSLYYLTATQDAVRALQRELLTLTRPVSVVVPSFDSGGYGSPRSARMGFTYGLPCTGSTAAGAAAAATNALPIMSPGGMNSLLSMSPGEGNWANTAELYGVNALFRVLSGVRQGGTPRWLHGGELPCSPPLSARLSMHGSSPRTSTRGLTMNSWHQNVLPHFHPPRRTTLIGASEHHGQSVSTFSAHQSSWLQGPPALEMQSTVSRSPAATPPASVAATGGVQSMMPSTSTTPRAMVGGGYNSTGTAASAIIGGPCMQGTRPSSVNTAAKANRTPEDSAASFLSSSSSAATSTSSLYALDSRPSRTPATPPPKVPQLPMLALGNLSGSMPRPAQLKAPPSVHETASPSLVTTPQLAAAPLKLMMQSDGVSRSSGSEAAATAIVGGTQSPSAAVTELRQRRHHDDEDAAPRKKLGGRISDDHNTDRARTASATTPPPPASRSAGASTMSMMKPLPSFAALANAQRAAAAPGGVATENNRAVDDEDEDDELNEVHRQQERAQRLKTAQPEVTEVLPYLFVGGETAARDRAQLLAKGVTHIVNTVSWCLDSFHPDVFHYLTLSLSDAADEPIFALFSVVNAFVEQAIATEPPGRVFIHCQQGVSRSCTFVLAYVMWKLGLCYDKAYALVRARRNVCSPNTGFLMNLRLWEAHLSTPQLNVVYAFSPYTAECPTPFVYQLATYYGFSGNANVGAGMSSADTSSGHSEGEGRGAATARENFRHLRADVLRRAVDGRTTSHPSVLMLDPRLCYLCFFAPSAMTDSTDIEACFLTGPECSQETYKEEARLACRTFIDCGFYHGETHASRNNKGRSILFSRLRPVRLHPAASSGVGYAHIPPSSASVTELQQLLSCHVTDVREVRFAPQPLWEALLQLPQLSAKLEAFVAAKRVTVQEDVRRRAKRAMELGEPNIASMFSTPPRSKKTSLPSGTRGSATMSAVVKVPPMMLTKSMSSAISSGSSSSAATTTITSVPGKSGGPATVAGTGRHTPRMLRPSSTPASTGGGGADTRVAPLSDTGTAVTKGNLTPAATQSPSLTLSLPGNETQRSTSADTNKSNGNVRPGGFSLTLRGPASPSDGKPNSTSFPFFSSAAKSGRSEAEAAVPGLRRRHMDASDAAAMSPAEPVITFAPAAATVLPGGDSFSYLYPFTEADKVVIADLDDLESEACYLLGFQQARGVTVYLWRGAESPLSVEDVVSSFAAAMLKETGGKQEALVKSLMDKQSTTCSLQTSQVDAGDGDGKPLVIPMAKVLFVEQEEEPEELLTLL